MISKDTQSFPAMINRIDQKLIRNGFEKDFYKKILYNAILPKAFRKPNRQLIAECGIDYGYFYRVMRNEKFNKIRLDLIRQYYIDDIPDILLAMKQEAVSGNPQAAKLFLEFVAEFNANHRRMEPFEQPEPIPTQEVNIIIDRLEQKFYGKKDNETADEEIAVEGDIA